MLRSTLAARRLSLVLPAHCRFPSLPFTTSASSTPPTQVPPETPPLQRPPPPSSQTDVTAEDPSGSPGAAAAAAAAASGPSGAAEELRHERARKAKGEDYEEEQERVLRAALGHVLRSGWSETALIAGARDVGVSPSIVGSLPRKEAALVEFFMDDCLQRLIDRIDLGEESENLILSEQLSKLIRIRLEMQTPYLSKWPEALSIQAQPKNLPTSFKQRAMLVDEFWHAAGDRGSDFDWYVKRTILGGIYSTSEVYMLTDHSPEFHDTWAFVDDRVKDAFDLQKTFQEAAYLAEAVGAGVGSSMKGMMKGLFQR